MEIICAGYPKVGFQVGFVIKQTFNLNSKANQKLNERREVNLAQLRYDCWDTMLPTTLKLQRMVFKRDAWFKNKIVLDISRATYDLKAIQFISDTWLKFLQGKVDAKTVLDKYKELGSTNAFSKSSLYLQIVFQKSSEPPRGTWIQCQSGSSGKCALGRTLCGQSKGPKGNCRRIS